MTMTTRHDLWLLHSVQSVREAVIGVQLDEQVLRMVEHLCVGVRRDFVSVGMCLYISGEAREHLSLRYSSVSGNTRWVVRRGHGARVRPAVTHWGAIRRHGPAKGADTLLSLRGLEMQITPVSRTWLSYAEVMRCLRQPAWTRKMDEP